MRAGLDGAWAGAVATLPMSSVMHAAERAGWMGEHPPEVIVRKGSRRFGVHPREATEDALAFAAHLAFGASAGALFGVASRRWRRRIPALVALGIGYGLFVYAVSYKGWLPAVHIMPQPEHDRPGRQPAMIAAHVIYGAALGALLARGSKR